MTAYAHVDIVRQVGAKALLGQYPKLNGFVGKMSKKKKWERLFGIVHENYLFLYKTQNVRWRKLGRNGRRYRALERCGGSDVHSVASVPQ